MDVDRNGNIASLDRSYQEDPEGEKLAYGTSSYKGYFKTFKISSLPESRDDLEELALAKMKCTDIPCIEAVEVQEKSLGWDGGGIRSLNGDEKDDGKDDDGSGAASSPLTGYVVPALRTEETCKPSNKEEEEESEYAPLSDEEMAAIASAGKGTLAGAALKEYEDMPVSAGGAGWPGVDAATRKDTMEVSKGLLSWKNRV